MLNYELTHGAFRTQKKGNFFFFFKKFVERYEIRVHNLTDYHTWSIWLGTNCCLLNPFKNFSSCFHNFSLDVYSYKANNHWKMTHRSSWIIHHLVHHVVILILCITILVDEIFICSLPSDSYIARVRAEPGNGSGSVKKAFKRIWHEN